MLTIDGARGEGGGQVLRTCLALAMVTGQPVRMENIRARRSQPGLKRQHLTAVEAAQRICNATVRGAALQSQQLTFEPNTVSPGEFFFDIGSAGSATLVLHTILPALLTADGASRIVLEGGTHNPLAPPFEHLALSFLPLINRLGPRVSARLARHGFYPAGGGRIEIEVTPARRLEPFELLERGAIRRRSATVLLARLPRHVASRELAVLGERLNLPPDELRGVEVQDSRGPGNAALVTIESETLTVVFSAFGRKGVPAEQVADEVARQAERYLRSDVPVDEHLADQLLLPFALAGQGAFRTHELAGHAQTQLELLPKFLPIQVDTTRDSTDSDSVVVRLSTTTARDR